MGRRDKTLKGKDPGYSNNVSYLNRHHFIDEEIKSPKNRVSERLSDFPRSRNKDSS